MHKRALHSERRRQRHSVRQRHILQLQPALAAAAACALLLPMLVQRNFQQHA
jgi:hypothetical protein